jgi:hypothetical protein
VRELFIYYRVRLETVDAARAVVDRFQSELRAAHPGLITRHLRRTTVADESPTWMETYALPSQPGGVTSAIEVAVDAKAASLLPLLDGPRHAEVFLCD